jgi:hypothetical protein
MSFWKWFKTGNWFGTLVVLCVSLISTIVIVFYPTSSTLPGFDKVIAFALILFFTIGWIIITVHQYKKDTKLSIHR